MSDRPLRVLALQPFYGGSHAQFHEGWVRHSRHSWTSLTLPDRHWKWRMRHAAIHFSAEIRNLFEAGERWDVVVTSDMLNLVELKGLNVSELGALPTLIYFHENQFVYPNQVEQARDQHFAFTNFISCIAADQVWFNSEFNRSSFRFALEKQLKHWPDFVPRRQAQEIWDKSFVQHPGIDRPDLDLGHWVAERNRRAMDGEPIRIVWAARWEFDKGPDQLLALLTGLVKRDLQFEISVIGQSYRNIPHAFQLIHSRFSKQIRRWGYQETRAEYWNALAESDLIISTASHEFFGLSVAEAIAAGCIPLLPNRLAYPELCQLAFPDNAQPYLYGESPQELENAIVQLDQLRLSAKFIFSNNASERLIQAIQWRSRVDKMDRQLAGLVENFHSTRVDL